jgi:hypothetical protein
MASRLIMKTVAFVLCFISTCDSITETDTLRKVRNFLTQVFGLSMCLEVAHSSIFVTAFRLFRFRAGLQLRMAILFIGQIPSAAD